MNFTKCLIFVAFLSISLSVFAQKGTIKGRVYDMKSNAPIEFANILIQGTTIGSTTDLDGNFSFTGVTPGFVKLVVSTLGYETVVSAEIQIQGNQIAFIDIPMIETSVSLSEVTVGASKLLKRTETPISVQKLGVQEIEKTAGANRDISKLVQTLPGVGATDPNRNDLIVRGGGPAENVFYLDGIEIPVINHFTTQGSSGGSVGVINPDFVREIDFLTGAYPANRPNALSSVMEIRQKEGSKDRVHGKLSVGASDAALTVDGPIGAKSTFIASVRQSYLQFLFSALKLPFLPTYTDMQVKYKVQFNQKHQLNVVLLGALDNVRLNTGIKEPTETQRYLLSYLPVYNQWNYTMGFVYKYFGEKFFDTWVFSRNMLHNANYKYPNNDESQPKSFDYLSEEGEYKLRYERNYPDLPVKINYGAGVNFAHYTNETFRRFNVGTEIKDLNYNSDLWNFSYQAFVQASDEFVDQRLKLSLGLSLVGNNYTTKMLNPLNQISPRFSLAFAVTPKLDLAFNVGRYTMRPSYTIMGFKDSAGVFVNKLNDLKYIASNQAVLGFEYRPMDNMVFSIEGFYKYYQNYPISVLEGVSLASKGTEFGQVGDEAVTSTGEGQAYGVELLGKLIELKGVNVTLTYTYFRSEFTDEKGVFRPSAWDTRHMVNLIAAYRLNPGWNFAVRWRFVGAAPYSPINESLSSLVAVWNLTGRPITDYANYNALRLRPTHQLDVRVDKEFYFKKWTLNLYADVQNVYNFKSERAPIYTNFNTDGSLSLDPVDPSRYDLRVLSNSAGTILPTIGIIVKY